MVVAFANAPISLSRGFDREQAMRNHAVETVR